MAKISIRYEGLTPMPSFYGGAITIDRHSGTSATFIESGSGNDTMTFTGRGLAYSASDEIVGGTITAVTFRNALGDVHAIYTGLDIKASALPDFITPGTTRGDFFDLLIRGNDRIVGDGDDNFLQGGAGRDMLIGGGGNDVFNGDEGNDRMIGGSGNDSFGDWLGNDRMTGGKGADSYTFSSGKGHDVITDFRGTGPESQRDSIWTGTGFTLRQAGRDVIVDFIDDGGTIRLLDVRLAQVQDEIIYV